jgi:streptogramin lyase
MGGTSVRKKRLYLFLLSAGLLVVSIAALVVPGNFVRNGFAQSGVTISDYWLNGGQEPWGTTFDRNGNVWMAIPGCDPSPTCSSSTPPGKIGEFNPGCSCWSAYYQLPSGFGQALFLAFDAQGNLWFPMPMSNSIGELVPSTNTFSQWAVPTASSGPWGIAIDQNGNIWFTEHYTNQIGEFNPSSHTFKEIATPAANSQPYGIVVDGGNNVWFTENNSSVGLIGEFTAGGTLNEYKIRSSPVSGLTPHLITVAPNGTIWWSEGWVGMIGELNVSQAQPGTNNGVKEFAYTPPCGSCGGTHTSGISVDSNGLVWFDDALQNIIGSFDPGSSSFSLYSIATSNAHPHDGLNVDGKNVIWFDEEFGNKIGKAVQNNVPLPTPTTPVPGKTPSPTATTQPSPTVTVTPSPTVTVSPSPSPSPGATIAQDTFQRANQKYWGTASDGLKWGGDANSNGVFSISGNAGVLTGSGSALNAVLGASATDAEVLVSGSTNKFSNSNIGAVLRWKDTNNWYKAYIDGSNLVVQKRVNGSFTTLKTYKFAAVGGKSYTIRFDVVGSTLSAKVWQTGTTEPSSWMISVSDTSLTSGYCGLRIQMQSGVTTTITSFQANVM